MNFNIARLFSTVTSLMFGFLFLVLGLFSIVLPCSSFLQTITIQLVAESPLLFIIFGTSFMLIGLAFMVHAWSKIGQRYAFIRLGARSVTLDKELIKQYLDAQWEKKFPDTDVRCDLIVKKNIIKIIVDFPATSFGIQKSLLDEIKIGLEDLFRGTFGYPYEVELMASFRVKEIT